MDQEIIVECWKDGELLVAYPFTVFASLTSTTVVAPDELIAEAKANLTKDGIALPPYEGIEFKVDHVE
jgi:hypothetical protein